jgi:hypothetical protein
MKRTPALFLRQKTMFMYLASGLILSELSIRETRFNDLRVQ